MPFLHLFADGSLLKCSFLAQSLPPPGSLETGKAKGHKGGTIPAPGGPWPQLRPLHNSSPLSFCPPPSLLANPASCAPAPCKPPLEGLPSEEPAQGEAMLSGSSSGTLQLPVPRGDTENQEGARWASESTRPTPRDAPGPHAASWGPVTQ